VDEVKLRLAINDLGDLLGQVYKSRARQASNIAREILGKYAYCPEPVKVSMFDTSTVVSAAFGIEPPLSDSSFGIIKGNIDNIFAMSGDEQAKIALLNRFVHRLIESSGKKEQAEKDSILRESHNIIASIVNGIGYESQTPLSIPQRHLIRRKIQHKSQPQHINHLPPLPRISWSFISDVTLRKIIARDYAELKKQREALAYKGMIIMCGSILEAVLISVLMKQSQLDIDAKYKEIAQEERWNKQPATAPPLNEDKWTLNHLISVAAKLKILYDDGEAYALLVKDYRNLVHPMKEVRKGIKPSKETANAMLILFRNVIAQIK
jgi:hypothetical protein